MERKQEVSKAVIQRLPRYYRNICELKAEGEQRISSKALAERMGLTASQIRQDFNCFGGFGQQGYGYNIDKLQEELGAIMGLRTGRTAILLGAGNLGRALLITLTFLPAALSCCVRLTQIRSSSVSALAAMRCAARIRLRSSSSATSRMWQCSPFREEMLRVLHAVWWSAVSAVCGISPARTFIWRDWAFRSKTCTCRTA